MAIKNLTNRPQLSRKSLHFNGGKPVKLGRLNKGARHGSGRGAKFEDFDYFRFTPYADDDNTRRRMVQIFHSVYGDKPNVINDVRIPVDVAANFDIEDTAWLYAYQNVDSGNKRLFLAKSDGENIKMVRNERNARDVSYRYDGEMSHADNSRKDKGGNDCFAYQGRLYPWQQKMKINLILPDFNRAVFAEGLAGHGVIELGTSSTWDIATLIDQYNAILNEVTGLFFNPTIAGDYERVRDRVPLQDIPLRLYRETSQITTPAFNGDETRRYHGERSLLNWQINPVFSDAMQRARDLKAQNLLTAVANAPLLPSTNTVERANGLLFGDEFDGDTMADSPALVADLDEIVVEYEEAIETVATAPSPKEKVPPTDWSADMLKAKNADQFALAAYQTKGGKTAFDNAVKVGKWLKYVLGNYTYEMGFAEHLKPIFDTYCNEVADNIGKREAADKAKASFLSKAHMIADDIPF